jgi:glutathione synthase/RimK-type ligase-like ATP-grasp enzyme
MAHPKKPLTIGSTTVINFPKLGIKKVPAKVDTGADSSSIWASNIAENNGKLSFTLFAQTSPFYNGKKIETRDYQIISIKNSFGITEYRYKVRIPISIEGRSVNVKFTLANRASNRFPILIGKRTIHGKFVVDVSKAKTKKIFKILIVDAKEIDYVKKFFGAMKKENMDLRYTYTTIKDLEFLLDKGKTQVRITGTGEDINKYDFVYIKSVYKQEDLATALAHYLHSANIRFIDRASLNNPVNNKLGQYIILQNHGIPVPKSIFISPDNQKKSYKKIVDYVGLPFVLKEITSNKGQNNFLVKNKKDFNAVQEHVANSISMKMIAQQYIENKGDYRILVLGRKIRLIIRRKLVSSNTHLNNTSAGGEAILVDESAIPGMVRKRSLEAANALKLDIAGVDMFKDEKSGVWYCLEVNHNPQIASGAFVAEKRKAFEEYMLKQKDKHL